MSSKCFIYDPAPWLPFRDREILEKCRNIRQADMEKTVFENPDFKLLLVYDARNYFVTDLFCRIKKSDMEDRKLTVIVPGHENSLYISLTEALNKYRVSLRNVHIFLQSEYADENGNVAPAGYECGKQYQFMKYFYGRLDKDLRPPRENIVPITTKNVAAYSDLIDECGNGGADAVYTSVCWSGRIAGIDPVKEFSAGSMEEYLRLTSRVTTPLPESIAEESLHGIFGCSGDVANVPPKMATIGPRDVAHARDHAEFQFRAPCGANTSWQRLISRLMLFGPVTQQVPASMLRLFKGRCYTDFAISQDIYYPPDSDPLQEWL